MEQLSIFEDGEGLLFPENLLEYYPVFINAEESAILLEKLIAATPWQQQQLVMYGKALLAPRLTAWYGDKKSIYNYSGSRFNPIPWTSELTGLRKKVEDFTHLNFNSVLLNYYRDGNDSVAWHSDDEKELGQLPYIASLSLGQARKFEFRKKTDHRQKYILTLTSGSLLIMKGDLQQQWQHRIPKSGKAVKPRVNLTFRAIF